MEVRYEGNIAILTPSAEPSEEGSAGATFEAVFRKLLAEGRRQAVINFERVPRPWNDSDSVSTSIVAYMKAGGWVAFCGARPPDPPCVIRELRMHFDSEREAVLWLKSKSLNEVGDTGRPGR